MDKNLTSQSDPLISILLYIGRFVSQILLQRFLHTNSSLVWKVTHFAHWMERSSLASCIMDGRNDIWKGKNNLLFLCVSYNHHPVEVVSSPPSVSAGFSIYSEIQCAAGHKQLPLVDTNKILAWLSFDIWRIISFPKLHVTSVVSWALWMYCESYDKKTK